MLEVLGIVVQSMYPDCYVGASSQGNRVYNTIPSAASEEDSWGWRCHSHGLVEAGQ